MGRRMKSIVAVQDRLAKQNEISRQKLAQEIVKLDKVEKSNLRMIETARHRFRSRHRNLEARRPSFGSNAINVRMYETHNPGFCYHCTGAIKESGQHIEQEQVQKDSYDFVRSVVFTKNEVDPDKLLCLHLLTAHSTRWNGSEDARPIAALIQKAKNKHFSGAWNNLIPCYVVDTQVISSNTKLHEDPRNKIIEDQAIREFEERYRQYMEKDSDYERAMSSNAKQSRVIQGFEKMPSISPHVYSLLGASHELRIKQALAEGVVKRKYGHYHPDANGMDEYSLSFHLDDDDDDDLLSRGTTNMSTRNWVTRSLRSPSRKSTIGSWYRPDHGITMLKSRRKRNYESIPKDLITIKSSFRTMKDAPSKTSSTKSPFYSIFGSRPSTNSFVSTSLSPDVQSRKCRKCIYLNAPMRCVEVRNKDYKVVPVLVNYQLQALVQTVFDVLQRVNPEKSKKIIDTARNTEEINKMLMRTEIQSFVQSLLGQSLVSSPESFVLSIAAIADEMDLRFEEYLEKEIVALTWEMPSLPCLDNLVNEIRNNIFETIKKTEENEGEAAPKEKEEKNPPNVAWKSKLNNTTNARPWKKNNNQREDKPEGDNLMELSLSATKRGMGKISKLKASEQMRVSGSSVVSKLSSNSKSWKSSQDLGHLDANHVILQRMTNTQRILVGQMCASLKKKRINNQGLINESVPLAALIAPALSRDSIKFLTRGTVYSNRNAKNDQEETEDTVTVPDKLTGPLLAKIRQDVAEIETKKRLNAFLKTEVK